jgi:hypothetical protein
MHGANTVAYFPEGSSQRREMWSLPLVHPEASVSITETPVERR